MFEEELFITITGLSHYYGMTPIETGRWVALVKEPENPHDQDAILVAIPWIGTVGYVANSTHTVARGCFSAGRIYDRLPEECAAVVRFVTGSNVIAQVFPGKRLSAEQNISLVDQEVVSVKAWCFSRP
ncbi:MAG: DNA-binding protein [Clostridiales bacterium]|nr:DNA-binding protein [Clostridiales bacterium]